jgi:hypothetical protein
MSGYSPSLARRSLLTGAAATALGAVLFKDIPPAHAMRLTRGQRHGIPVGVTVDLAAFPRGVTTLQAFKHWEQVTGCPPLSTKIYFNHRQFPTKPTEKLAAAIARGMTAVLCYEPAFGPPSGHDRQAIAASLKALRRAGLRHACVVLWTEPQDHNKLHVPEKDFHDGFQFYAPAVRASGWPLYYNANSNQQTWAAYYPGDAHCDGIALDDYAAHQNWSDIWARGGIARLAEARHKSFGWFEMGRDARRNPPSVGVVADYLGEATAYLAGRIKAGRRTGPVIWYNGNGADSLVPLTRWRSNNRIARQYYPAMYNALT